MTTMSLSVQVSRTLVGAGEDPLELNSATGTPAPYRVTAGGLGPGVQVYRRETVTSPVVAGRVLLSAVEDVQMVTLKVRARGTTYAELNSRVADLLAAFKQESYSLTLTMGGEHVGWLCEKADYGVGEQGVFVESDLRGIQQVVTFTIPRSPIPLAGGY